jgi:hypothetical protein
VVQVVEPVERQEPPAEALHVPTAQLSAAPSRYRSTARMVAWYGVTVFFLITVNFFLPRVVPGDPIEAQLALGTSNPVDEDTRAELARYYGLDDPLV